MADEVTFQCAMTGRLSAAERRNVRRLAQRSALARAELEMAYTETWKQAQAVYEE